MTEYPNKIYYLKIYLKYIKTSIFMYIYEYLYLFILDILSVYSIIC